MKPIVIIVITVVLLIPNAVFASHVNPSPFDANHIDATKIIIGIIVLVIGISGIVIFGIRKMIKKKRKEKQRDDDIQKLKDKVKELEKNKEDEK